VTLRWGPFEAGLAGLVLAVAWLYAPALEFAFLSYDDPVYVTRNPHLVAGFSWQALRWAFSEVHAGNWHPLTWLSHMLDVAWFGMEPAGHHAMNVALHGTNTALVFAALRALTGRPGRSLAVAALFAVHPLQIESVAWIAERKNLLSTSFGLLAITAYAGYARHGGARRLVFVTACMAASLLAKAMWVTLPFLLLLLDVWPLERRASLWQRVREKWPLFALSIAASLATYAFQQRAGAMEQAADLPGLARLACLLAALGSSPNRFVLTTRYVSRAHRLLRDAGGRFEVMHLPALSPTEVTDLLAPAFDGYEQMPSDDRDYLGRSVQALTDGRAVYVRAMGEVMSERGATADPVATLTTALMPGGALDGWCQFCYELRLHRARGYGALKAILDILADEEPLTLTAISQRLHRTPGSTKDYLSWLEDVDLVISRQKRYSFTDPLLRLWVRLHCRPAPPSAEEVVREVQRYASARLPKPEPKPASAPALAYAGVDVGPEERKSWGIIEID
jgi:hypothetical protein